MKQLSVDRVAAAIRAATTDRAMRQRAAEIGAKVRAEDGVGQSVRLIEQYVARFQSRRAASAQALSGQLP